MNKVKKIVIFAGTTEGRKLSECLAAADITHSVCVATEYGEIVLQKHPLVTVRQGRMNREEMEAFLTEEKFSVVIDATHPFAEEVTHNIKAAVENLSAHETDICYLRLNREDIEQKEKSAEENIRYFETNETCAKALEDTEGNILLTTGSKELAAYCILEKIKHRLYVRLLPDADNIALCTQQGICGKQIIAMQGPFTAKMNEAIIQQYQIAHFVTKESGMSGGYQEKLEAIQRTGIQGYVIRRPQKEEGYSFVELCGKLEKICDKKILPERELEIVLAGIGMGNENCMTKEVGKAINEADILMGTERLLEKVSSVSVRKQEKYPFYQAEQIIPYLKEVQNLFMESKKAVVLFSGDSGFYSGCRLLYEALEKEICNGQLKASMRILPGISSVSYLASCIGVSYQDAAVYSMHGKEVLNLVGKIKSNAKTFLLMSGVKDVNRLGKLLTEAGMTDCRVVTGYQLSYKEQRIEELTPAQCCELKEEGLYACFVSNPYAVKRKLSPGIADKNFIRDKVPMTKEEVRAVSICKLRLREDSVVYDIGSGTGSVAMEMASLSDDIRVYAVEKKKEALSLIRQNKDKFGLDNITIVEAAAPDKISALPPATHAFIGGSGGRLKEILDALKKVNPHMRIVINAISMETICEIKEVLSEYRIKDEEVIQVQISRAKTAGDYHLMQGENPVWICSFDFA
ncbi:MAG: precorrin-6A reductase [Bacillus sp. (in: Bacteria)]|nr:precorrin-6A reductase [Bacillus sp. (in: firmicutes)]MCM1427448.1 precorrin-6A reductase [Eubacterium sp.]